MTDLQYRFMQLMGNLPPRLTPEQTAWLLNCKTHDIPVITAAKLIKPLGNPKSNSVKYYCTKELLEASADRNWLSRVTNAIYRRRKSTAAEDLPVHP